MENITYCQSCGMPLSKEIDLYGTNADGGKNQEYCIYCFKDGGFTANTTMDAMIEFCIPHMMTANPEMTKETAREMMKNFFPSLKRWKNK